MYSFRQCNTSLAELLHGCKDHYQCKVSYAVFLYWFCYMISHVHVPVNAMKYMYLFIVQFLMPNYYVAEYYGIYFVWIYCEWWNKQTHCAFDLFTYPGYKNGSHTMEYQRMRAPLPDMYLYKHTQVWMTWHECHVRCDRQYPRWIMHCCCWWSALILILADHCVIDWWPVTGAPWAGLSPGFICQQDKHPLVWLRD